MSGGARERERERERESGDNKGDKSNISDEMRDSRTSIINKPVCSTLIG